MSGKTQHIIHRHLLMLGNITGTVQVLHSRHS